MSSNITVSFCVHYFYAILVIGIESKCYTTLLFAILFVIIVAPFNCWLLLCIAHEPTNFTIPLLYFAFIMSNFGYAYNCPHSIAYRANIKKRHEQEYDGSKCTNVHVNDEKGSTQSVKPYQTFLLLSRYHSISSHRIVTQPMEPSDMSKLISSLGCHDHELDKCLEDNIDDEHFIALHDVGSSNEDDDIDCSELDVEHNSCWWKADMSSPQLNRGRTTSCFLHCEHHSHNDTISNLGASLCTSSVVEPEFSAVRIKIYAFLNSKLPFIHDHLVEVKNKLEYLMLHPVASEEPTRSFNANDPKHVHLEVRLVLKSDCHHLQGFKYDTEEDGRHHWLVIHDYFGDVIHLYTTINNYWQTKLNAHQDFF